MLAELRAGADFLKAVKENISATRWSYARVGKLYDEGEWREEFAKTIASLNPGDFIEPIRLPEGYLIVRLDERIPATLRKYDDPEVQKYITRVITLSRAENARKDYMAQLREKAHIEACTRAY